MVIKNKKEIQFKKTTTTTTTTDIDNDTVLHIIYNEIWYPPSMKQM